MWEFLPPRVQLRGEPCLTASQAALLREDFERFREGLAKPLEAYIRQAYDINLTSSYGGVPTKNPFGKASGQLSLAAHQIQKDAEAGLAFVVLKTVIAQDGLGQQSMVEWALPEARMLVERCRGRSGKEGWTISWKGRGWGGSLQAYQELFDQALSLGQSGNMLVVPSVKYHLPAPEEHSWNEDEYLVTTRALQQVWDRHRPAMPMPIEKDFSPTLAASPRASQQETILNWLRTVPKLIHRAGQGKVRVGMKLFNALFEDRFQVEMLQAVHAQPAGDDRADYIVYANRLFDPAKEFNGTVGVAYGGPDLSDRNLAILERFTDWMSQAETTLEPLSVSATGNIHAGRIAAEYLLRGASTFQMHTLFQLPDSEFPMRTGSKTERVVHRLLFDPHDGFLAWILHLRQQFGWKSNATVFDMANWCRSHWKEVRESCWT